MRFAASCMQHQMQQLQPNAICHHSFKKRIELRTQEQPLVAKHIGGTIRDRNDRSRTRRTDEVPFIAGCSHFTRKNTRFRAPASSPKHSPCNIHAAITMRFAASRQTCTYLRTWQHQMTTIMQPFQCDCNHRFKKRIELRTQEQPLVAKHIGGTIRDRNDRSRTRRTDEVPFIAGCSHFTRKNTRFRAPASSPKHSPCNIHAAIQCDLQHTSTTSTSQDPHRQNTSSPLRPSPPHRCQPFIKVHSRLIFPSSPLPFLTTSLRHHFPSLTTSLRHHFPSSPLPFVTTSLPHHFPSSPLPFFTTSLPHHFPSSPLPFLTTSLLHHFPSSPLPFLTTFPSSPLPFVTTSLPHHFPSSPLPFVTTSSSPLPFLHHFPSSPLPFLTTSLPHHFPSSPLPSHFNVFTTSLLHHFPSSPLPFKSPLPFIITSFRHHVLEVLLHHPLISSLLILLLCIVILCIVI